MATQGHTIGEARASLAEAVGLYLGEVDDPAGHVTATPLVTSFQLRCRLRWVSSKHIRGLRAVDRLVDRERVKA